jgi:hypothetical protein
MDELTRNAPLSAGTKNLYVLITQLCSRSLPDLQKQHSETESLLFLPLLLKFGSGLNSPPPEVPFGFPSKSGNTAILPGRPVHPCGPAAV